MKCVVEMVEDFGDKADTVCAVWEILGREQMVEWRRLRWLPFKEWAATGCVVGLVVMDGWEVRDDIVGLGALDAAYLVA